MNTKGGFWGTQNGKTVLTILSCAVIWGITLALWASESVAAAAVMLICAYFGWQSLTKIQPAMFVWMPVAGWFLYFAIKFFLSATVGLFVAPFYIGRTVAGKIHDSLQ